MSTTCTILIADDDTHIQRVLAQSLEGLSARILFSNTAAETLRVVADELPDLVLLDIRLPDCTDLSLLRTLKSNTPELEVIILSGMNAIPMIVEAIRNGAYDFVSKPFVKEEVRNRVSRTLDMLKLRASNAFLVRTAEDQSGVETLVGDSLVMRNVRRDLRKLAETDGCVLIQGESGTGKELAARGIHFLSKRRANPFIVINTGAIPESLTESFFFGHRKGAFTGANSSVKGAFQAVEDGTLFLDEIGDMRISQQTSLLRVLEYRTFMSVGDVVERQCRARFLFATNNDLGARVGQGEFRHDLFYRLNVASIMMPPLRDRVEDVPMLASYFCRRLTKEMGKPPLQVAPDALQAMMHYTWPGNVRELRNVLERAIMLADSTQTEIGKRDLPAHFLSAQAPKSRALTPLQAAESKEIARVLKLCEWNQRQAAAILGLHRNTLRMKIRAYDIGGRSSDLHRQHE